MNTTPSRTKGKTRKPKRKAFHTAYTQLNRRVAIFTCLPLEKLDALSLKNQLDDIGRLRERGE